MRFEEAVRRLEPLPDVLPDGPDGADPGVRARPATPRPRPALGREADARAPGRGPRAACSPTRPARRASCSPSASTAAATTRARSRSRAAAPSPRTPTSSRRRCARRPRRSGLDADAGGRPGPRHAAASSWIPVSNSAVTPVVAVAERRPALVAAADGGRARSSSRRSRRSCPTASCVMVEREIRGWRCATRPTRSTGSHVWGMTAMVLGGLGAWLGRDEADVARRGTVRP